MFVFVLISCGSKSKQDSVQNKEILDHTSTSLSTRVQDDSLSKLKTNVIVGANRTEIYLPLLRGKRIGIVANQTSVIFKDEETKQEATSYTHLVDSLLALNLNIKNVFSPEHGFRGIADAGELVKDGVDTKTKLPIVSLYGSNKKPTPEQLAELDIVVFDVQDVGARFYTYISTLHYVMEACAEANISILILDRPNPNGHYIDGPIMEPKHKSFVGMHPIPVVHGMTIGEYAKMINGEGWLKNKVQCNISVIAVENYTHQTVYSLPIKPSPNLPNDQAINLYPSLCLFEGTNVNAGRGTSKQFQIYGSPYLDKSIYDFSYFPSPNEGAKHPKHDGELCYGEDLSARKKLNRIDLSYVIRAYKNTIDKNIFFIDYFTTLAGTTTLQQQIESGVSEKDIRSSWEKGLSEFQRTRSKYLIYR